MSIGGIPMASGSPATTGDDKRSTTNESFKLYLFGGEDYAWKEWWEKFLAIACSKAAEDYLLPDPEGFFPIPMQEAWKAHKKGDKPLKTDPVAAWEAKVKVTHLLTLGTNGVPFSIVKGSRTKKLPQGDT